MSETLNERQHQIANERFEEWLVGQVAGWIAQTWSHIGWLPGSALDELIDDARGRNARCEWTFDGPLSFRTWPRLTEGERDNYCRRYSGVWLESANLERAIEQGRVLVQQLTETAR